MSKKNHKEIQKKLKHKFNNVWEKTDIKDEVFDFGEEYKEFLDNSKTERLCFKEILKYAKENGFKSIEEFDRLETGDKVYIVNKEKSIIMSVIGKNEIKDGLNIIGSHIDSPRLDLKPNPLYEDSNLSLMKTHYYGGVRKYQWTTIPLAMHGVLITKDNKKISISIGEKEDEPVFYITDLLPHLAKDQRKKKLNEAITGEGLNLVVGSIPLGDKEIDEKIKFNTLNILNEKYGIKEKDFLSAEIEVVPAGKSRDVGFDRGLISGYGHDDRVCAFAELKAILDVNKPKKTAMAVFVDKEEIGSMGNTGAKSKFLNDTIATIIDLETDFNYLKLRKTVSNSKVLSADVGAGFDPTYPSVSEKNNTSKLGNGVQLVKYTGSGGKYGCNDANAEFLGKIINKFDENDVIWQVGELGKVDQGGGGTIAFVLANEGAEVIDCGVPVLGMHAPFELISKADLYMTYKAYNVFMK
ncbi:MAG: aminopeptidase [Bacillota bacterium]